MNNQSTVKYSLARSSDRILSAICWDLRELRKSECHAVRSRVFQRNAVPTILFFA